MVREKAKEKLSKNVDERLALDLALTFILSFVITIALVIPGTFIHEALHYLGALLEGGAVKEVVWFNFGNWFSTYIHPITVGSGELGSVTGLIPRDPVFGKAAFYFLPYIVMFPVSVFMMLGDNVRYLFGGDGISNLWRIVGGPLFILNFAAFWTDLALYKGGSEAIILIPAIYYQLLYLGVIVSGVVGSTVYLYFVRDT